jgi:hypothetical protein
LVPVSTGFVNLEERMKSMLGFLMVLGLALGACGNNDCEDATDKVKSCNNPNLEANGTSGECSGQAECYAKCINASSCAEMADEALNSKFNTCVGKCFGG